MRLLIKARDLKTADEGGHGKWMKAQDWEVKQTFVKLNTHKTTKG